MATGSGKTIVMAMVIAWHILNKVDLSAGRALLQERARRRPGPDRARAAWPSWSRRTRQLLRGVQHRSRRACCDKLRQGKVIVRNWHALNWESEEKIAKKRSVDKRGAKSDEAYVRDVLGDMASAHNILVINDEAHHAWRVPAESKVKGVSKDEIEEATKWVGGLDRINQARGILTCLRFFRDALCAVRQEKLRGSPLWLDRQRLRPERRHRIRPGQDPARGGARRRRAGRQDLQVAPLSHLQRRRGEGRSEPQARAEGAAARPRHQRLLPPRLRLAGDREGVARAAGSGRRL